MRLSILTVLAWITIAFLKKKQHTHTHNTHIYLALFVLPHKYVDAVETELTCKHGLLNLKKLQTTAEMWQKEMRQGER